MMKRFVRAETKNAHEKERTKTTVAARAAKSRNIDKNGVQETRASRTQKICPWYGLLYPNLAHHGRVGNPNFETQLSLSGKLKLYL